MSRPKHHAKLRKALKMPPGYIRATDFAENVGISDQALGKIMRLGERISYKHQIFIMQPNDPKRAFTAIDWNNAAYPFLMSMSKHRRPTDFVENKERIYKPIETTGEDYDAGTVIDAPEKFFGKSGMAFEEVIDLSSAKYRSEQLKIARQELELRASNNELVEVSAVVQAQAEQAVQVRVAVQAAIQRLTPLLAVESDIAEVKRLLLEELNKALASLDTKEVKA